jgi:lipopolysaccharide export system protein LptA
LLRPISILLLALPAISDAQEPPSSPRETPALGELPATSLLPNGSQMKNVVLPRYTVARELESVLKAETMTLVSDGVIKGNTVTIDFLNPDQSAKGRIDLVSATVYQAKGMVKTQEPVKIRSDQLYATGSGLFYSFAKREGFLLGPVTTTILSQPEKTMTRPQLSFYATVFTGFSLSLQPLQAAPPPNLTTAEKAAHVLAAESKATAASKAAATTQDGVDAERIASEKALKAAAAFITAAEVPKPEVPTQVPTQVPAKPLEVQLAANTTLIESDGGMYFDAEEGVLVYLGNVRVTDARFDLKGANELKIFFAKKPGPATPKTPKSADAGLSKVGGSLGKAERIIATGAVLIHQKPGPDQKPPIDASGAVFNYDVKTGETILSGGYPWVKQGDSFMRAKQPELILRIQKSGSFITQGKWSMGGNLDQTQ